MRSQLTGEKGEKNKRGVLRQGTNFHIPSVKAGKKEVEYLYIKIKKHKLTRKQGRHSRAQTSQMADRHILLTLTQVIPHISDLKANLSPHVLIPERGTQREGEGGGEGGRERWYKREVVNHKRSCEKRAKKECKSESIKAPAKPKSMCMAFAAK